MLSCPAYRGFAQGVLKNPRALLRYMGYALFAGRKPGGSGGDGNGSEVGGEGAGRPRAGEGRAPAKSEREE
jgi:hypothetical protein